MIAWHDGEANTYPMPMIASTLKKPDVFHFRGWTCFISLPERCAMFFWQIQVPEVPFKQLRYVQGNEDSCTVVGNIRSCRESSFDCSARWVFLTVLWSMWFFSCCNSFFLEIISLKHTNSSSPWVLMVSRRVPREWRLNSSGPQHSSTSFSFSFLQQYHFRDWPRDSYPSSF